MSRSLPNRANLEWLKKLCKDRLAAQRVHDPEAKLADAQLAVAREYGFPSWRKLKAHVEQLRAKLAEVVSPDDADLARLLSAVDAGDLQTVTEVLGRRPILSSARGPDGRTPLHAAAWSNDPRLGAYLVAYGADPEAKYGESGHTALSWAVTCDSIEFAKTLVRLGAKQDLFCAAGIGSVEEVRAFFDETGTLLPGAARTGSSRIAVDGTRLPCPPATPREQVSDALYIACRNAHPDVVRFLLTKEPDLSFRAYMGATPLHWAHYSGSRAVIEMLEQAGADPTARDDVLRCTPRGFGICVPCSWGIVGAVRDRLGEDPTLATYVDGGASPLHEAARNGHAEIVALLLEAGARIKDRG